ncbi:glycoside hydrolase family 95-like protein [Terrimonas rubra]|uniref:Glycoside hydrolase family 95-like protein n=1 Tax=Terrimonas rubra TaxID=1035890 RepID=A0ABW6A0Z4_9BACT
MKQSHIKILSLLVLLPLLFTSLSKAQTHKPVNWQEFLSRNDAVYDTLTTKWEEGVFTGNGLLGAMINMKSPNELKIEIGNMTVVDHRGDKESALYAKARLPIGHFTLQVAGNIKSNTARLQLWNAEATGLIQTDKGTINWRSITLSQSNIIIFQYHATGAEQNPVWRFFPETSISSRTKFSYITDIPAGYQANPPYEIKKSANIEYCRQPMLAGGDYTTAWTKKADKKWHTYIITIAYNRSISSTGEAIKTITDATATDINKAIAKHRSWWHNYYPLSFVSLPDPRMESFYWLQMYKVASATRNNTLPLDLMGPWYKYTRWPAYWFNLNIQLTYSPLYTANRLQLAEGLLNMIDKGKKNLSLNVPQQYRHNALAIGRAGGADLYRPVKVFTQLDTTATLSELELGNLTWILYYYWQHYRYTLDDAIKQKLIPLLKGSINYYLDIMYKEDDGKWHLPFTHSPEYPDGKTRDCNYDLALFRWGCQTLLQLAPTDALAAKWQDVLTNLTDYPRDDNGLKIGQDVAFKQAHRHYSHLLMIYPLYTMNWDQVENRTLIKKSLEHWHSFTTAMQGYSFTGGAAIYTMMGDGDMAVKYLDQLFSKYIKPNTLYLESGPVIETPLAAAETIHTLLLQSWGNIIRVFPAVPGEWKNVAFKKFRTDGAFLISAVKAKGETRWVEVESLKGGDCIIKPGLNGTVKTKGNKMAVDKMADGNYRLKMQKGERVILYINEADLTIPVNAVIQNGQQNYWGKKTKH